jgi:hypothetical protein
MCYYHNAVYSASCGNKIKIIMILRSTEIIMKIIIIIRSKSLNGIYTFFAGVFLNLCNTIGNRNCYCDLCLAAYACGGRTTHN